MSESEKNLQVALAKPPVDFLDWILFVPYLVIFFSTLLVFELIYRCAHLCCGERGMFRVSVWLNSILLFQLRFLGAKIRIENDIQLDPNVPYIMLSNHQSLFDIPISYLLSATRFPRFVAKKELGRWIPAVSYNLRKGGHALVDRKNLRQALPVIRSLAQKVRDTNGVVVIYPEGTRSRTGELKPFKTPGVAILLREVPGAKIIPLAIDGSWKLQAYRHGPIPRGVTIRIVFGEILDPANFSDTDAVVQEASRVVAREIEKMRLTEKAA